MKEPILNKKQVLIIFVIGVIWGPFSIAVFREPESYVIAGLGGFMAGTLLTMMWY